MGKKEVGTKREYTQQFKIETVRLAKSIGGNAAASRLGVPQSTVANSVRRIKGVVPSTQASSAVARLPVSDLEAENMGLRRELANAKLDLDIVKNLPRILPRPIRIETSSAYTALAPGQRPLAFWRQWSPSKNLAQGKLRTQLWWHQA